jgi:hypothetical protein
MHAVKSGPLAVISNVYAGLQVLFAELYWLAVPDLAYRRKQRSMAKRSERLRFKLLGAPDDTVMRSELAALEADMATEASRFSALRAQFLERLRVRIGFTFQETPDPEPEKR